MRLSTFETSVDAVSAGYACPCGCRPSLTYRRGGELGRNICCCGNVFLLGPGAEGALVPQAGFQAHSEERLAGWGETVTAAWLIGPSTHPEPEADADGHDHHHGHGQHHGHGHDHDHHHDHGHDQGHEHDGSARVTDPVCGMRVDPADARERGLHHEHGGHEYFFCGKGCLLDFRDDPERILALGYIPSM